MPREIPSEICDLIIDEVANIAPSALMKCFKVSQMFWQFSRRRFFRKVHARPKDGKMESQQQLLALMTDTEYSITPFIYSFILVLPCHPKGNWDVYVDEGLTPLIGILQLLFKGGILKELLVLPTEACSWTVRPGAFLQSLIETIRMPSLERLQLQLLFQLPPTIFLGTHFKYLGIRECSVDSSTGVHLKPMSDMSSGPPLMRLDADSGLRSFLISKYIFSPAFSLASPFWNLTHLNLINIDGSSRGISDLLLIRNAVEIFSNTLEDLRLHFKTLVEITSLTFDLSKNVRLTSFAISYAMPSAVAEWMTEDLGVEFGIKGICHKFLTPSTLFTSLNTFTLDTTICVQDVAQMMGHLDKEETKDHWNAFDHTISRPYCASIQTVNICVWYRSYQEYRLRSPSNWAEWESRIREEVRGRLRSWLPFLENSTSIAFNLSVRVPCQVSTWYDYQTDQMHPGPLENRAHFCTYR